MWRFSENCTLLFVCIQGTVLFFYLSFLFDVIFCVWPKQHRINCSYKQNRPSLNYSSRTFYRCPDNCTSTLSTLKTRGVRWHFQLHWSQIWCHCCFCWASMGMCHFCFSSIFLCFFNWFGMHLTSPDSLHVQVHVDEIILKIPSMFTGNLFVFLKNAQVHMEKASRLHISI